MQLQVVCKMLLHHRRNTKTMRKMKTQEVAVEVEVEKKWLEEEPEAGTRHHMQEELQQKYRSLGQELALGVPMWELEPRHLQSFQ